jgi:hypothetical protein
MFIVIEIPDDFEHEDIYADYAQKKSIELYEAIEANKTITSGTEEEDGG